MNSQSAILECIGGTPLVPLSHVELPAGVRLLAKLERFNPMASVKDRIAWAMIADAERRGRLAPGGVVVEATSGNTGIGLAMVCAVRGYRLILTMPETMSRERRDLLTALGAELILTSGEGGMKGALAEAERLETEIPGAFVPRQFDNPANPEIHERTTGPEIWEAAGGEIAAFVAGIGTGGTISGVGRYLKRRDGRIRVIGVEPQESPFLSEGRSGAHVIQGIGAGFRPAVLDLSVVDDLVTVSGDEAAAVTRSLARTEGLFVGISSGAAVAAAVAVAARFRDARGAIVTVLPDGGERYLSTTLWGEET
ncbi:MAG: cysteine synthase A [Candidatus Bipolaricaulota bacterium]|nr:MAG: cysteine synthase A [Candidatus Bipolaricaulota bacterium]